MKYIKTKKDYGYDETYAKWNGKFLDENSYDEVITVTEDTADTLMYEIEVAPPPPAPPKF